VRAKSRLFLILVLASGCGGSLTPALDAFEEGRLPAAAIELRALEPRFATLDASSRARYALYRGLVELGLGNAAVADHWLFVAYQADRADPRCFDDRDHGALLSAWRATGRLPGEPGERIKTAQ
jgi:hypothetical protein